MQPVIIGIDRRGTLHKIVRAFNGTDRNLGLCGGELQAQVPGQRIGGLRVGPGGIVQLAIELEGVREFSLDLGNGSMMEVRAAIAC